MASRDAISSVQASSPLEPGETTTSARRLKKREIDRRCQRQARERTKTRIAYLEGLVDEFRHSDSSGQVATLMKQLQEAESQRDVMAKTLKDIQKAMESHKPLKQEEHSDDNLELRNTKPAQRENDRARNIRHESNRQEPTSSPQPTRPSPPRSFDLANFSPSPSLPAPDQLFAPEVVPIQSDDMQQVQTKDAKEPHSMASSYADNWDVARRTCSCHSSHGRRSSGPPVWQGNYWRYANEVFGERFTWAEDIQPESDELSDDVVIRALNEGWEAVSTRGPLHPSWSIVRQIDETLFSMCANVERLSIMRAIHTLLQFHTASTSERYAKLPSWYMRRPSQKIPHSYGIDFFAWPGLRERFIFSEHDYCGNEFWSLFTSSFKMLWPYEWRDCYTREIDTGLYKVSPQFDERLADIKCWTMGPDIFKRFPELYSDMPTFNHIPSAPSNGVTAMLAQLQRKSRLLPPSPPVPADVVTMEEEGDVKPLSIPSQAARQTQTNVHGVQVSAPHQQHLLYQQRDALFSSQVPHPEPIYITSDFHSGIATEGLAYAADHGDYSHGYRASKSAGYQSVIF